MLLTSYNQLTLDLTTVIAPINSAPEQHLMVGDRVKRKGDPYSIYEVAEVAAGIANLKSIACTPGVVVKDLNAPLFSLILIPVETVLEQLPSDNPVELAQVLPDSKSVLEQELDQSAPEQKPHWIESYSPANRKGYNYYRYVWMQGRKLHHIHIPGNVNGPIARRNYLEVELAIAMRKCPSVIEQLIKSWRHRKAEL